MALIKCVECEKKISTLADSCTHCGAPIRHSVNTEQEDSDREEKDRSGLLLKLFLLLAVLGLGYLLTKKHVDPMLMCLKDKVISKVDKATDDHSITGLISGEPEDSRDSVKPTTVFDTVRTDGTSEPDNQVSPNLVNEMLGNDEQPPKEISEPVSEPTAEPNPAPASDSSPERIPPQGPTRHLSHLKNRHLPRYLARNPNNPFPMKEKRRKYWFRRQAETLRRNAWTNYSTRQKT